jgi:8-oxo-dGTP pyrophosphatase MutT (NUDIX family)
MHDIFQPGLVRGSGTTSFDPEKSYFFVETPDYTPSAGKSGWRVYLRACCFIHEQPEGQNQCVDLRRFIVVKKTGMPANAKAWDPPKGQMEGKDAMKHPRTPLLKLIETNIRREVEEESRIRSLKGLEYTGLVLEGVESNYPKNTFFQYHIFRAQVATKEWMAASSELDWCRAHPAAHARMKRDYREKDALSWYSPSDTKLIGKWAPKLVIMYLKGI